MQLNQTEVRRRELQDEVASLTRARDLSERAYKAGAITLTDVLDADRQLLVARDDSTTHGQSPRVPSVPSGRSVEDGRSPLQHTRLTTILVPRSPAPVSRRQSDPLERGSYESVSDHC
jgi:hypothetical protein